MRELVDVGRVGGHETFTPRYGWLKKGYDRAKEDPYVFNAPDAIERLGVGKNMVRSIRFWCLAFHILEYVNGQEQKGQKGGLQPTRLGDKLLGDNGWDPFLEDVASLWLLHWQLFIPPFYAASWPVCFNHVLLPYFEPKQLICALIAATQNYEKLRKLSQGSFEKDGSCIIRMYVPASDNTAFGIESPFSMLGIIRKAEEANTFRFEIGEKQSLSENIFAAACLSYAQNTQANTQRTLSLHRICFDYNSPGVAFKVSETEAGRYLDQVARLNKGIDFVESMGYQQLQFTTDAQELYWQLLELHYGSSSR
jgi:hypothetical protein